MCLLSMSLITLVEHFYPNFVAFNVLMILKNARSRVISVILFQ
jgi:hypothetical protein